jgi:hypothetical protein
MPILSSGMSSTSTRIVDMVQRSASSYQSGANDACQRSSCHKLWHCAKHKSDGEVPIEHMSRPQLPSSGSYRLVPFDSRQVAFRCSYQQAVVVVRHEYPYLTSRAALGILV